MDTPVVVNPIEVVDYINMNRTCPTRYRRSRRRRNGPTGIPLEDMQGVWAMDARIRRLRRRRMKRMTYRE